MTRKKLAVSIQENNVGCEMVIEVWSLLSEDMVSTFWTYFLLIHGVRLVSWRDCGVGMARMLTLPSKAVADITNQTQMTLIRPTCPLCIHLNRRHQRAPDHQPEAEICVPFWEQKLWLWGLPSVV